MTQPPSTPPPSTPPPSTPPSPDAQTTQPMSPAAMPPPPPPGQPATPRSRMAMVRAILAVLVLGLTVTALAVEENETTRGYEDWTAWAIFATVCAAVHLLPLFSPLDPEVTWTVVAIATAGLVLYWVAIVLPSISSNLSFAQTLAVALAVAHLWLLPGRRL